ncbi:hypothetical protein LUZ60_005620 [Juncus effusus]|nr:hypothetical protein LUZ60_005620 [Juncus effusus]
MEKCRKPPRYEQPSFSSSLLDSIYRSMDESDGTVVDETEKRGMRVYEKYGYKRDYYHQKLNVRTRPETGASRNRSGWAHSTSSSSDCSSYGGFSSSEAESVRLKPIRTASRPDPGQYQFRYPVQSPSNCSSESKKKSSSSVKNKLKEFRKSSSKQQIPSSPGAKLASFLNAIFAKKGSKSGDAVRKVADQEQSACSTASSYTRSCLSKTPSTAKRSVRFVVEDHDARPCSGDGDRRKRVAEILRGIEREEEEEESDASSDLFELEDLTVGIGKRFRDELPVYGTTSLGMNNKTTSHVLCRPVI